MKKKLYIAPYFKILQYEVTCLDNISRGDGNDGDDMGSKSVGGGGGIDWDAFDNDTEE